MNSFKLEKDYNDNNQCHKNSNLVKSIFKEMLGDILDLKEIGILIEVSNQLFQLVFAEWMRYNIKNIVS